MRKTLLTAAALAGLCLALPALAAGVEVANPLGNAAAPKAQPQTAKPGVSLAKPQQAAPAATAVFPKAVDPKYAKESAGQARMHTCLDQYKANAASGNGGMKWIEKGGGYYSECNKRLKG